MLSRRNLARSVCAAFLILGAQFVATLANAHAGHSHDPRAPIAALSSPRAQIGESAHRGHAMKPQRRAVAEADNRMTVDPALACTAGCCTAGMGCCAVAFLHAVNAMGGLPRCGTVVLVRVERPPGITPEAVPRPPKYLA